MPTPEIDLALPGDWWRIPLRDLDAARRSVHAYVESRIGTADEHAQARADLRGHLMSAVAEARRGQGIDLYLGAEILPGVPVPVTMTVYAPDLPTRLSQEVGVDVAAASLAASLDERGAVGDTEITLWNDDTYAVVREVNPQLMTYEQGDQEYNVRADYWLLRAGTTDTVLIAFSSPLIWEEQLEALLELFDAIIGTVDWIVPLPEQETGAAAEA